MDDLVDGLRQIEKLVNRAEMTPAERIRSWQLDAELARCVEEVRRQWAGREMPARIAAGIAEIEADL